MQVFSGHFDSAAFHGAEIELGTFTWVVKFLPSYVGQCNTTQEKTASALPCLMD
ncbi:MAG TPA: hypothetical protein VGK67_24095 [Myxococcales bacterium]|jgi:hypothetical protein